MVSAEKPKRAWRIVHSESSPGWGGQERRILAELTGFRSRGAGVWLLAPDGSGVARHAVAAGLSVSPLNVIRWQFPLGVVSVARRLRRLRVDILNTHSSRDGWLAGLAGRLARVPLIVRTRHFDVPVKHPWLSRVVYARLADHVLTTSPKVTDHFRELFRLPDRCVTTVPTGIDLVRFTCEGPRSAFPAPAGQGGWPLIGMVGVLRWAKGHTHLLHAARRLKDEGFKTRYLIVGDGPAREVIAREIGELGLGDRVLMQGHREDMPEVFRSLDLLVMPSLHEGIPQVLLQAMACGTPVAGSNIGGIPSVIEPGRTGRLFPPGDARALAQTIRDAVNNPEATQAMCAAGRVLVSQRHSLETMLDTLEGIYERYLGRDQWSHAGPP